MDALGRPLIINFYNGYSRDVPAQVFGSVSRFQISGLMIADWGSANTPSSSQVLVDFSVVPEFQMIRFSNHVFKLIGDEYIEPDLTLQTACLVRDNNNNAFIAYQTSLRLPGYTNGDYYLCAKKEDVTLCITSTYNNVGVLTSFTTLEADPIIRANYYLTGMVLNYMFSGSQTNIYNGIVNALPDGAISQITWSVDGSGGASTTISLNTEHDLWIPRFPARRRAEFCLRSRRRAADSEAGRQDHQHRPSRKQPRSGKLSQKSYLGSRPTV